MAYHNTRSLDRVEQLEDIYEIGDVLFIQRMIPYAAIKTGHGQWHISNVFGPTNWRGLLDFIGHNEVWAATEWSRVQ